MRCHDCPDVGGSRPVCCCDEPREPERRYHVVLDGLQGNRAQRRAQAAKARKGRK